MALSSSSLRHVVRCLLCAMILIQVTWARLPIRRSTVSDPPSYPQENNETIPNLGALNLSERGAVRWRTNSFFFYAAYDPAEPAYDTATYGLGQTASKWLFRILGWEKSRAPIPTGSRLVWYEKASRIEMSWWGQRSGSWTRARSLQAVKELAESHLPCLRDRFYTMQLYIASPLAPQVPVVRLSVRNSNHDKHTVEVISGPQGQNWGSIAYYEADMHSYRSSDHLLDEIIDYIDGEHGEPSRHPKEFLYKEAYVILDITDVQKMQPVMEALEVVRDKFDQRFAGQSQVPSIVVTSDPALGSELGEKFRLEIGTFNIVTPPIVFE